MDCTRAHNLQRSTNLKDSGIISFVSQMSFFCEAGKVHCFPHFHFLGYKGWLVLDFYSHISLLTTLWKWKGCEILHEKGNFFTKRDEAINLTKGPSI